MIVVGSWVIKSAYRLDANWKVTALVVLLLPLLLKLGFWQLDRADEKRHLQQLYASRAAQPHLSSNELQAIPEADLTALAFRHVVLRGTFDNDRHFLLDNQILNGAVGYHLLTPLTLESGSSVLVNRGWIGGHADRRIPSLPEQHGVVELVASIYVPQGESVVLGQDEWSVTWPVVVQSVDVERAAQALGVDLFDYELRIQPGYPGSQRVSWPAINTRPEKHTGYAVQWFVMAAALLILWLYSSIEKVKTQEDK
ncbi:MAG: SURF1 family protein [Pseudomonadales bacterium]|nr:SURF1 family protein [Pseudomonadales bacterium]